MSFARTVPVLVLLSLLVASRPLRADETAAADVTTIRVTDEVLVPDISRFGINLGGDNYYSGAVLTKMREEANFEGTTYRQCHFGPVWKDNGMATWFGFTDAWKDVLKDGTYTVLSGPSRWTTGKLKGFGTLEVENRGEKLEQAFIELDRTIEPAPVGGGILVESLRLDEGKFRPLDGYWASTNNRVVIGDTPKGSFGRAALRMDGTQAPAHFRMATAYQRYMDTRGTWRVRLWARAVNGEPTLRVACTPEEYGDGKDLKPGTEWALHEVTLTADKVPEPANATDNPHLLIYVGAKGGAVLVDDVQIWKDGDTNPTAFRDDCLAVLEEFRPGPLRLLQMGGNTLANTLQPPIRAHAYASQKTVKPGPYEGASRSPYGLHQMYELCEKIGSEPWYCLPGTLNREEIGQFMEYLAAPADVGFGKVRADMGHPVPWTEVFKRIHVEFGNEAWNNAGPYKCGGFNGPDYWKDLIATGKASPHYRTNVLFHAAGQAASTGRNQGILANAPNADRFSVAPYITHDFSADDAARLDSDEKLFRWAFAVAIRRSTDPSGSMVVNYESARKAGIELSIYEVNHHTTQGDGPLEPRNRLVTSLGGGLNVANDMLLMLREQHLRSQCLFSLVQHGFKADAGVVRLWGTCLNMRGDQRRYRPTFLAVAAANRVLGGNLVRTVHSANEPTFEATGRFEGSKEVQTVRGIPSLFSYAVADGKRRGLILVNLDVAAAQKVRLDLPGAVEPEARTWQLAAERITDHNEFENAEPKVRVSEGQLKDFASGATWTLPAHSMTVLGWQAR